MNWERAIDSALQNSIRQLTDIDGSADGLDVASLTRETEVLKANAGRDSLLEVLEQEKGGDMDVMQVLLSAQFDIISSLNDILCMNEQDAVQHAKTVLKRLLQTCSTAASQVVKPDGSLNVAEAFPPTKRGTPKRKKQANFFDGQSRPVPTMPVPAVAPQGFSSPMKSSPKRRKATMGKKGISFTPKKKSPSKRSVRWRDDTESGALAEFEKTPQKMTSTPELSSVEQSVVLPALPPYLAGDVSNDSLGSSPIPIAPEPSIDIKPKANRFQAGFLSKKSGGSPPPPNLPNLSSSDTDQSPLRTLDPSNATNRSSLHIMEAVGSDSTPTDSGNNSSSESENTWHVDRSESAKISRALKRNGSVSRASHAYSMSDSAFRTQRRRSPTAATMAGSPPNENLFTASHARRMVKSEKEGLFTSSVLSPRTAPVVKNSNRRTTIGGPQGQMGGMASQAIRLSGTIGGTPRSRESVTGIIEKGGWR
jgi:kinesin family protein 18/19